MQRSARRLLLFASVVTLALNVAEPLIAGRYGKAAFDAVGPLLLIGWGEVGPGLIEAMHAADRQALASAPRVVPQSLFMGASRWPARARQNQVAEAAAAACGLDGAAREQDLMHRARAEDVLHWQHYHRPISAETLRKRLRIGSPTARRLVAQLRSDMHIQGDVNPATTEDQVSAGD